MVVLVLFLLVFAGVAQAQDATVRAEVDARRVGVQDQVELTLTLEGRSIDLAHDVAVPPLQNLRVAFGPSLSQQISMVNGAMSQAKVYTWVLQPVAPGQAEVGAFRVRFASGEKTTAPIAIEVVPGALRQRQRPQRPADPFGEDPFESLFGRRRRPAEAFVSVDASASRPRLHVGEPLLLTYSVCTTTTVTDLKFADAPQYPGFWSEDLEKPEARSGGEAATVDGHACRRFPFLQKLLFPTRSGTLTIPAATVRLGIPRQAFFDPGPIALERATKPLAITVDPIPSEPGFSGAVGKFRVTSSVDRSWLSLGEAATLRFTVEGSGNLKWIDRPPEVTIPGAKVYPPQVKSDLRVGRNGIDGSKTWEFVVIPETSGTLEVPPLPFAYFDSSAGRVVRTRTAPVPLRVDSAAGAPAGGAPVAALPRRVAGSLALRSDLDLPSLRLPSLGAGRLALGLAGVLLLHGAIWGGAVLADRRRSASGRSAPRRSLRAALAELQRAGRGGMNKEASAALIEKTLHDLFGPVEDGGGPPANEREKAAREILQEVHFIRYAPQLGDYSEKIRDVASRAAEVVRKWA